MGDRAVEALVTACCIMALILSFPPTPVSGAVFGALVGSLVRGLIARRLREPRR